MKVLFINKFGQHELVEMQSAPRIGDTVTLFYQPWPKVNEVVWNIGNPFPQLPESDCVVTVQ